ncbi:MAG TPA: ABC transporter permease subunit [Alphaproteobacteria bacterium]|nr:ABC transporter permease subunit [Alphaproteobacteria bacterium]
MYQAVALLGVIAVGWFLVSNTLDNLSNRGIVTGFGFLERPASFAIGEVLAEYSPADTFARALYIGLLNTLFVSALGIVLATLLGATIGIARLSPNWPVRVIAGGYVEMVRNVPLLLQLFLWYALITQGLPGPREAIRLLPGVFLSNRGLVVPWFGPDGFTAPHLAGFNFQGGAAISPELAALLFGLSVYTAAFIAEVVRGGILAVPKGQTEAALSLGLSRRQALRFVILPQALRIIVPPLSSQYLNLLKNSSLAVAIGYPDLVSVANTAINITGQAIEGFAIVMAVFVAISLALSALMNWYNRRIAVTR